MYESTVNLSLKQKEAVFFDEGAILVNASAGSGKTRVLTERIKRLLDTTKRKILAITFTNKAGEEMKERLENAEKVKTNVFVGTFHGFCQQVLELRGNLIGLPQMPHIFEEEADRLSLIEEAISLTPSICNFYTELESKKQRSFRYDVLDFISEVKRDLLTEGDLLKEKDGEDLVLLYNSYQEILTSQNAIDFDDLIKLCYHLFTNNPSVAALYRRTYEYICIDEAQDLNFAQYQLLKSITGSEYKNVMMVGDPNQSIFAFNGSLPDYMNKYFIKDFSPKIIELKENYRSSKEIVKAAEKIIPGSSDIVNMVIPGIFEINGIEDEEREANWIVDKIQELVSVKTHDDIEGEIIYEKIAILARNKYVFTTLETKLKENKIPFFYKITQRSINYESKTMNVFDLALRVKLNPSDNLHWLRLLAMLDISGVENLQLLVQEIKIEHYKKAVELVMNLKEDGANIKKSFNEFGKYIKDCNSLSEDDERKMILDEIEDVLKHWYHYAKKNERRSLHQFKNAMALGQTHPLTQNIGIALSTVHTMKGQEYDIVFLMGMDDGTFPDYRAIKSGGIEITQEKNNTYVAFTRARRFLYVTYPKSRLMPWGDKKQRGVSRFLKVFYDQNHRK
jgi:DNA helicase II / ATP-dependent DNA helicase PcrA